MTNVFALDETNTNLPRFRPSRPIHTEMQDAKTCPTVDKKPKLGYSINTKGATSRSAPQGSHEEIIVTLERWRLSLLVVFLEYQGNDSYKQHTELEQF